jgi:hypothetical protein
MASEKPEVLTTPILATTKNNGGKIAYKPASKRSMINRAIAPMKEMHMPAVKSFLSLIRPASLPVI